MPDIKIEISLRMFEGVLRSSNKNEPHPHLKGGSVVQLSEDGSRAYYCTSDWQHYHGFSRIYGDTEALPEALLSKFKPFYLPSAKANELMAAESNKGRQIVTITVKEQCDYAYSLQLGEAKINVTKQEAYFLDDETLATRLKVKPGCRLSIFYHFSVYSKTKNLITEYVRDTVGDATRALNNIKKFSDFEALSDIREVAYEVSL